MKSLSDLQKNLYKNLKQSTQVKYTFKQALRPFNDKKLTDTDPSSKDYVINLSVLKNNQLPPIVMCVQKHNQRRLKLTCSWYINKYQEGSLITKNLAKKNGVDVNYIDLAKSSRLGIVISKDCSYQSLSEVILQFTLAILEISNYLQVNSYLDSPDTLKIQKLNS